MEALKDRKIFVYEAKSKHNLHGGKQKNFLTILSKIQTR